MNHTRKVKKILGITVAVLCSMLYAPFLSAQTEIKNIKLYEPSKGMSINFTTFANKISDVANAVIPFLIGLAIVFVIFGIFKYISSAGDTEKVAAGRTAIIWGVVAIFLMLAFWGLVIAIHNSIFGS